MNELISGAQQVTPGWLTALLRERGILPRGQVLRVTPGQAQSSFASSVWRLEVDYSADAFSAAPHRLFLKCSNPATAPERFDPDHQRKEILFYQTVAPAIAPRFAIPCYAAAYQPETGASHLLLKDVSASHQPVSAPPSPQNYDQAVDVLAELHAFWWDHPSLGKEIGQFPTPAERRQEWLDAGEATGAFIAMLGERLPAAWSSIYRRVLAALPDLYRRHAGGRHLTLAHGDAHLGNFLFPASPAAGPAYLLDWQFWHATIGGTDLAFLLATEAELETRRLAGTGPASPLL